MRVAITAMGGVDAAQAARGGGAMDVVVLASNVLHKLEAEGRVAAGSIVDVARSGMAIAIPAGAPRPDIGDAEAVRRAIAEARTVCLLDGGRAATTS